jgi:hypothetical protein
MKVRDDGGHFVFATGIALPAIMTSQALYTTVANTVATTVVLAPINRGSR